MSTTTTAPETGAQNRTHQHQADPADRTAGAATTAAVRQAVQQAMDRRDNGGETGHTA